MTTYNEQVYAGMPFQYKIVKDRYWDKVVSKSITVDTVDDVTLEPYDGVTITQDGTVLFVSAGILPDGGAYGGYRGVTAPAGKSYLTGADGILPGALTDDDGTMQDWNCFYDGAVETTVFDTAEAVAGKVWLGHKVVENHITNPYPAVNFTQVGEVAYAASSGKYTATFTGDGNYLVADAKLPNNYFAWYEFDFTAKITPKTPSGYNTVFRNATTNAGFGLYGSSWYFYSGSRTAGGTATADTTYWIKVQAIFDDEAGSYTSTLYVLPDNGSYTLETLPALSEWTQAVQINSNIFMYDEGFWLSNDGNASFNGDMQLDQIELKAKRYSTTGDVEDWYSYWKPLDVKGI